MGTVRMNCRKLFFAKPFWLATAMMAAVMKIGGSQSELLYMTLPVITTIPYANALLDEITTGFWKFALHRCRREKYLLGKVTVCWFSGAAVVIIAGSICAVPWIFHSLCGGACALMGMAASLFTNSRATSYFVPFLAEYLLVILSTRYFPDITILNPQCWISFGAVGLLLPLGVSALFAVMCWKLGRRRLVQ